MKLEQKQTKETKTESRLLRYLRFLLVSSVFAFCVFDLATPASAQLPPQSENRFLFVINTSSAMRHMTNGVREAVLGLLQSGMQGQMRDGDTFGIWTYDDQLHDDFPMKIWTKKNQAVIQENVAQYLGGTRYEKKARLEKVMPAVRRLIAQSRALTVIFIFDGSETMQGTGFDTDINDLHKEFGRQVRGDNTPFVTVLAVHDGKVFDYRVRTPSSVSLPQTAGFIKPAETNTAPPVAVVKPPPAAVVAPPPPEPRHLDIVLKPTPPALALATPLQQAPPEKTEPVIQPAPPSVQAAVAIQTPVTSMPGDSSNQQSAIRNPQSLPAAAPPPHVEETTKQSPNINPVPAAPAVIASETLPTPLKSAAPVEALPAPVVKPVTAQPDVPPVVAHQSEAPAEIPNPQSAIRNPQSPPPRPTLVAPTAVALPSPADHVALLVIAFSLVTIAIVLVLFLIRRSRTPPSLISQSMDRPT